MMQCQRPNKREKSREIVPKAVWGTLGDNQQQEFLQAIERICQQLAGRVTRQMEGHDEAG
jgi:hypothetical protein